MRLTLDRFLAAVAAKAECPAPAYADVTQVILERIGKDLASWEARTLKKACIAVISGSGRMSEMELLALGPDARALLRALAVLRTTATAADVLSRVSRRAATSGYLRAKRKRGRYV
jgi:hypothetical protein